MSLLNKYVRVGDWNTEEEALQAYNIADVILNDGNDIQQAPVPSMEVYKRVLLILKGQGWTASQQDMHIIRNMLRIKLGMDFPTDA